MFPRTIAAALVAVASLLVGCGSSPGGDSEVSPADAGADAAPGDVVDSDSGADTAPVPDAGVDTAPLPDVGVDTAPLPDVGVDTAPVPDVGVDTTPPPDAGVDTAPLPDAGIDGTCFDFERNGDETEVDCGGSCAPCLVQLGCERACAERAALDGACPVEGGDCASLCEDLTETWGAQVGAAAQACLATNYLCFETLPDCMRSTMYPEPFEHDVVVNVTGMEAYDGARVAVGLQVEPEVFELRDAVLEDGRARIVIPGTLSMRDSHLVVAYVDDNGDGVCGSRTEPTMSGNAVSFEFASEIGVPSFEVTFDGSEFAPGRAPFVCAYL